MEQKAGAQISQKAFLQSVGILLSLMIVAGILTRIVPAGMFDRNLVEGRELIDPDSFRFIEKPVYPVWRWITAPLEVLWSADGLTVITIIVFLLRVGVAFAIMDKSGILKYSLGRIVQRYSGKKYSLLLIISFFFMLLGAFFGIFEEVVPLVPLMIALSYSLGWDALVGLGMSILATNMGFSAAITNPFTIGVAQKIAQLPLFSGAWLRVFIFIGIYIILSFFLVRYAKRIERTPEASPVFLEDQTTRLRYAHLRLDNSDIEQNNYRKSITWLFVFIVLILAVLFSGPFIPALSGYTMPIVGILFFLAGIGCGLFAGMGGKKLVKAIIDGLSGIAPAIPLILMAASIKYIVAQGGIIDTILYRISLPLAQTSPYLALILIYILALVIEFFISSGSAKAFLLIPILVPLADMVGITRQLTVTAYCFGDGFSNLAYPTNPVLLICLGLSMVSYPRWLKWTLPLWLWVGLLTLLFLWIGMIIQYGPF
ncbi:MAG: AbgT family transporter [Anaerolineaceae bacterium]